ncbi:hypothetical protein DXG01_009960 [Tephrocybe rancida]|nr:hypothetical protein DXG01_009960 [Tephrocybe rancida]
MRNARGRIGWTALREAHFGNKRADIVDAAKRSFVQFDEAGPLGSTLELEFMQVEFTLKNLYTDKFKETTIAAKLDVAVKDLTPEMIDEGAAKLSPLEQDAGLATTLLDAITRQKRRSSSPEDEDNTSTDRPAKRARYNIHCVSSAIRHPTIGWSHRPPSLLAYHHQHPHQTGLYSKAPTI